MEERIIDDEYGRGIRMKKTKDGYVDVTDELAREGEEEEEIAFEFPAMETEEDEGENTFEFSVMDVEEDDEDLVGLSPEEAMVVRQRKKEARQKRQAKYQSLCEEGEELLSEENYEGAEAKFEEALQFDELATVASVGYWRAKTANFTQPDALVKEYVEEGIESMEYDLGIQATDLIRRDFHEVFQNEVANLEARETPLAKVVEEKQNSRRGVLKKRIKKSGVIFLCALLPFIVSLIATAILGIKITAVVDNSFILPTVIAGVVAFGLFIATLICLNKLLNALRMRGKNENLASTEEGAELLQIRRFKKIYEYLAVVPVEVGTESDEE